MKAFILILLLATNIFSSDLLLKKSYTYDDNTLYASDFFAQIKEDFTVITIPDHLTHFTLAQQRIFDLFAKNGISLDGVPIGLVHFNRLSSLDFSKLEKEIADYFSQKLPFLSIKKVTVNAKVNLLTMPKSYSIEMKKQAYKNFRGTAKVITQESRYFFNYEVDATYSQFQTAKTLRKDELITASNTKLVIMPFTSYHNPLIGFEDLGNVRVRKYLKKGSTVYKRDVEILPLVKKGSVVNVKVIEGNILINFTATAQNDGALNDIITIKRNDGTRRKAKVVGVRKVELE